MDIDYDECYSELSSRSNNVSLTHIHAECMMWTHMSNKTRRYMSSLMDLEHGISMELAVPLMGYATPVVNVVTLVLNTIITVVLTKRRLRSPTNAILVSIAFCDTLTAVLPLPGYFYVYTFKGYRKYPNMVWCGLLTYVGRFLPVFFHTITLWLSALLSFNRYVGVSQLRCHIWTVGYKGVTASIVVFILISLLCNSFQLFIVPRPITVIDKEMSDGPNLTDTCYDKLAVFNDVNSFEYVHTWVRLTVAQVLPCLFLVIFNVCLFRVTYKSYLHRRRLVRGHRLSEVAEARMTIRISTMLLLISSCTCVSELFVDVILIIFYLRRFSKRVFVDDDSIRSMIVVSNFLIFLSFHVNFFFILALSSNFRQELTSCLRRKQKRRVAPQCVLGDKNEMELKAISCPVVVDVESNNIT